MKKIIMLILLLALVASSIGARAEQYPATMKVVKVDYEEDIITLETFTGFTFLFEGCEDWIEGDCASLIMEDNGTEEIFDDTIVMMHYCAWELINWTE